MIKFGHIFWGLIPKTEFFLIMKDKSSVFFFDMEEKLAVEIITGNEVFLAMEDQKFLSDWKRLLEDCPWGTVFQSPDFIGSWINNYSSEFIPILVVGTIDIQLIGLMILAIPSEGKDFDKTNFTGKKIVGAGSYYALHQVWISKLANSKDFVKSSVNSLFKTFPGCSINFKFLPTNTDWEWIQEDPDFADIHAVQIYRNPTLDYRGTEWNEIFRKRHLKAKFNRLNRAGKVRFEKINEVQIFGETLDQVAVFQDLRQGAMFNKLPFSNDCHKKGLFIGLFNKGILHATVLKLDGETLACVVAVKDFNGVLHLAGLVSHSPFFARFSPGLVHFFLLGKALPEENIKMLKLTPGDDAYKEKFSTGSEDVHDLIFTQNKLLKNKRLIRSIFHQILLERGIRPSVFNLRIERTIVVFKKRMKNFLKADFIGAYKALMFCQKDFEKMKFDEHFILSNFQKNKIEDLLCFDESQSGISQWEFLEDAWKRIEAGESCLTWVKDSKLMGCIWCKAKNEEEASSPKTSQVQVSKIFLQEKFKINEKRFTEFLDFEIANFRH